VAQDKEPLIGSDFIKTKNIIPDVLHLFLRVSDKLMLQLRNELQQMETTYSESIELNVNFKKLVDFLLSIKIRRPFYLKDKTLTIRDLSGLEYKRVYEKIDISIFNLELGNKIASTWTNFYDLIYKIKDDRLTSSEIKNDSSAWLNNYLETVIDTSSSVTPYMHILVSHFHQQVEYLQSKGLSINSFSMQGLEKMNDFTTTYFQRSTNKKDNIELQIFSKRTRVEFLTNLKDEDLFQMLNQPKSINGIEIDQNVHQSENETDEELST